MSPIFNGGFEGFHLPMKIVTMTSASSKLDNKTQNFQSLEKKRQVLTSIFWILGPSTHRKVGRLTRKVFHVLSAEHLPCSQQHGSMATESQAQRKRRAPAQLALAHYQLQPPCTARSTA